MSAVVETFFKPSCGCGCGLVGGLRKPWRDGVQCVRLCRCRRCLGQRNRNKGDSKAREARKALRLPGVNSRHEELWGGPVTTEIKAGAKAKPVGTAYERERRQALQNKPLGNPRGFMPGYCPDGTRHTYFVIRDDELETIVFALAEAWGYGESK